MRWFLVTLALLLGAGPAFAQPWGQSPPGPVAPEPKVVKRHHHRIARKHAVPKPAKPERDAHKAAVAKAAHEARKTAAPAKNVPLPMPAPKREFAKAAPKAEPSKQVAKAEPAKQTAKAESPKPEPAKDEATGSARSSDAFAGIPPGERLKIQSALFWAGDYSKAEKGDDPTEAAIRSFQKRNKAKITGVLTTDQRAELAAADDRYQRDYGWRVVIDPATGVRIGLPTRLVPNAYDAPYGTRWTSPHGEVQVETFRIKGPSANLAQLFEDAKKHPANRRVESSALHDDSFYISGMQGLKEFAVRARLQDGEVRGFTILYDQMMETIVEPAAVAMASAFSPFPEHPAPFAALAKRVEYGTGLIVSARGDIVTARKVTQSCEVIVADRLGNAERLAEDETSGLALLRVYGKAKLPALALPREAAKAGDITLVGIPDPKEENGGKELIEFKARLLDGHAIALRQPAPMAGFSGAAALDAGDHFLGIMETRNFVLASAQPTLPPVRLISAATIRDFLAQHHVEAAAASGDARAAAVRIICVRK
jgi:hypothetical protein